ncbi:hypothetical protein JRI60_25320 [Archangium violaceum]|uniref:hypothetical protein n=1 Tax=Archangium violaceum TaxID=83451 RepID=UPI00194FF9E6|nr:hypothetical protein [Archangium violaceum]QRO02094.1 hypothetical protein JRI60_25320 [Archangium violaceum]
MRIVRRLLPAVLLLAGACGGRGDLYTQKLAPLPLLTTGDALVSVVPQTQRVVRVRQGEKPQGIPIAQGARRAVRLQEDLVAVLTGDLRHPLLQLVSVDSGDVRTLELPGAYDTLAFSADNRFGVLSYSTASLGPDVVARNLNEVAVVDVEAREVTRLALGTESLAPRSVVFAPPKEDRQYVAITLDRGVVVLDAKAPRRAPRRIPTRLSETQPEVAVQEALFSPNGDVLFLRLSGMDDVFAVELGREGDELTASVNFLAGGTGLSDIELPPASAPAAERSVLAVYAGSQEAMVLDARGLQDVPRLPLGAPLTSTHVLADGRALFYDAKLRTVVAWDVATGKSGTVLLSAGFDAVRFSDALGTAVFRHPSVGSGGAALSVVTVREEDTRLRVRINPIPVSRTVGVDVMDTARGRLYFVPQGQFILARLDVETLAIDQVTLDAPISALHYLPARDMLAAQHAEPALGDVTLIPADRLERGAAERVRYFTLADELDRAPEGP